MITVDLTQEQARLLKQLLESCLSDLRVEIRHTDRRDFRDMLKTQEAALLTLQHSLAAEDAPLAV